MKLPQPIAQENGPGRQNPHRTIILLSQQLHIVRIFPLPLRPSILKPNLDLRLRQLQGFGQLAPLRHRQILVPLEFRLQILDLRRRERRPRPLLPLFVRSRVGGI